jgi:hypothetical protein
MKQLNALAYMFKTYVILTKTLARFFMERIIMKKSFLIFVLFCLLFSSCFTSQYYTREPALVQNVDIDQSIKIATTQIEKTDMNQGLAIWVLRDQVVTPAQARTIAKLYLTHIDSMKSGFNIWHSSWAISNLYRLGNDAVKAELETAYQKAKEQPEKLKGWEKGAANSHINGEKITSGFIHVGGRYYARGHLVVPGNKKYLQSYEEYVKKQKK